MQRLHSIKIFNLLLLCVLLLSLFSTVGTKMYHAFVTDNSSKDGNIIGPVDVSDPDVEDVKVDFSNIVSQSTIRNLNDESEIIRWTKEFGSVNLPANKPFSLLSFLTESGTSTKYSNEALSVIATGIYSTVLSTNFEIIERHTSDELPSYAAFGYEARVENKNKDLMIYNVNPHEYKLMFSFKNHEFNVQLMGPEMKQSIVVAIEDEKSFDPKIIRQFDSTLSRGEMVVKQEGISGQVGKIYRIIKEVGVVDAKVKVAEDYYPPIHTIEAHSIVPEVPQNPNDLEAEGNIENPDGASGTNKGSYEEKNQESGNETDEENGEENIDLWEDPDPLHLQKS
ncbi:G5 domain-containing protein [Bacillus sp. JJ1566]|uniref:G5 domain-containing protein n=1 Tax=Bacillus sp. JJ1566 TaxID=3122961 RepID=UPI002FFF79C5